MLDAAAGLELGHVVEAGQGLHHEEEEEGIETKEIREIWGRGMKGIEIGRRTEDDQLVRMELEVAVAAG